MKPHSLLPTESVLVTGCSGLIGSRLCSALAGNGVPGTPMQIIGFDVESAERDSGVDHFFHVDLTDEASVRQALEKVHPLTEGRLTSVVHLAAYYDFSGEPNPMYDRLTVGGTRRLIRLLRELQFDVEQFLFTSTLLVMQPEVADHLTESSPVQAEWAYPQSKLDAEQSLRQERGDIPIVILRIAGVYDDHCHALPIAQQIGAFTNANWRALSFPATLRTARH